MATDDRSPRGSEMLVEQAIVDDWRGDVSKEAIAEAVRLARDAWLTREPALVAG